MTTITTDIPTLTLTDIAKRMVELADERPEHVYRRHDGGTVGNCWYAHPGSAEPNGGGCLVGQALASLGVPLSKLEANGLPAQELMCSLGYVDYSSAWRDETLREIRSAQSEQDSGLSWGDAVASLRHFLRGV
jgi:hypothetical protein